MRLNTIALTEFDHTCGISAVKSRQTTAAGVPWLHAVAKVNRRPLRSYFALIGID
jgi:hypothetical protein